MEIIQAVLQQFGRYDAALEREYIQRQQKRPPTPATATPNMRPDNAARRARIVAFLRRFPQGWTLEQIQRLHPWMTAKQLGTDLGTLCKAGTVEREYAHVQPGIPQRYRAARHQ